jgi:hypothetical protein
MSRFAFLHVVVFPGKSLREFLDRAVCNQKIALMERQQAKGYARVSSEKDESAEWEAEQEWGDV